MAVCFDRFSGGVGMIHMIGKAPRVNRPAVAFGFALNNHLSQQSTSTTRSPPPEGLLKSIVIQCWKPKENLSEIHPKQIIRKSLENRWNIYEESIEPLPIIYRTSIEYLLNICRASIECPFHESQLNIDPKSIEQLSSIG